MRPTLSSFVLIFLPTLMLSNPMHQSPPKVDESVLGVSSIIPPSFSLQLPKQVSQARDLALMLESKRLSVDKAVQSFFGNRHMDLLHNDKELLTQMSKLRADIEKGLKAQSNMDVSSIIKHIHDGITLSQTRELAELFEYNRRNLAGLDGAAELFLKSRGRFNFLHKDKELLAQVNNLRADIKNGFEAQPNMDVSSIIKHLHDGITLSQARDLAKLFEDNRMNLANLDKEVQSFLTSNKFDLLREDNELLTQVRQLRANIKSGFKAQPNMDVGYILEYLQKHYGATP